MKSYDVIVVGGGPGGYTAALYAARSGLSVAVLEKLSAGGQMATTSTIENFPGFPDGVDGFELGERMAEQAQKYGAETIYGEVTEVELAGTPKIIRSSEGEFAGRTVILATGAYPRELGLPGEQELRGRGVAYCATCDGMMFRGKTVVVNGGGNTAVEDALYLSRLCAKVYLVHRRDQLRASPVYRKRLDEQGVEILWNSRVTALRKDTRLTGVELEDVQTGARRELACDGIFVAVGRVPDTGLFAGQVELDSAGYLVADESCRTSLPGVFAVGDVRTKAVRQVVTAAADGANAAYFAEAYLLNKQ
ncbi:thioredoxin-disulfide reductase [uncultured Flavonifractor sp.]|uniref:thioredoxin-disulfide reductase n=1 Tax=uncultured Flavonifractor sp. TaxID=1193534 RepID=UPI00260F9F85|nr:thioredoxin-disulfide reductase [uncultured Flavonifractor sp.]